MTERNRLASLKREALRRKRPVTDDAAIVEAYRKPGATMAKVGKLVGLSGPGVLKALRRAGAVAP